MLLITGASGNIGKELVPLLLRVVIGQQISVAGATTLMRRLADRIGVTPAAIAGSLPDTIAALGMPGARAATIHRVGGLVADGQLDLGEPDPQRFMAQLLAVRGIGPWTAAYLQMRVQRWPDAFPAGDLGLQKAVLPGRRLTEKQLSQRSAVWQPWRSYAALLLWKSLDNTGG